MVLRLGLSLLAFKLVVLLLIVIEREVELVLLAGRFE